MNFNFPVSKPSLPVHWYYSYHSSHLLSVPSHTAFSCSFNLLPLYQANPTWCLSTDSKHHRCTLDSTVKPANKTQLNLCSGPLHPSCLLPFITQDKAKTSKLHCFIGHCLHTFLFLSIYLSIHPSLIFHLF